MLKVGCRWCDCPAGSGSSTTVYNQLNRWSRRGSLLKLLDALVDVGGATKSTTISGTSVKAQRAAFGAKGGPGAGDRPLAWRLNDQGPRNRNRTIRYDKDRYRGRRLIDNVFCRVAAGHDKLAAELLSAVTLATAVAFQL